MFRLVLCFVLLWLRFAPLLFEWVQMRDSGLLDRQGAPQSGFGYWVVTVLLCCWLLCVEQWSQAELCLSVGAL